MGEGRGGIGVGNRRWQMLGALLAAVLVAVAVVLAFVGSGGAGGIEALEGSPQLVAAADLAGLEASLEHPVYWARERPLARPELHGEGGNVYLRYLPPGDVAGDPERGFLTVGTYPVQDPVGALEATAEETGTAVKTGPGGAVFLSGAGSSGSVYLAYPGTDLEVEVYSPRPGQALRLVRSGAIVPVGG